MGQQYQDEHKYSQDGAKKTRSNLFLGLGCVRSWQKGQGLGAIRPF